jgi:hypothetical protein
MTHIVESNRYMCSGIGGELLPKESGVTDADGKATIVADVRKSFECGRDDVLDRRSRRSLRNRRHALASQRPRAADSAAEKVTAALSAAADLAWRTRPRYETSRSRRLPRLVRLVFRCSKRMRHDCLRRRGRSFRGFGPSGSRQSLVFFQTAVFVFASGTAVTRLVAPRPRMRRSRRRQHFG